MKKILFVGAEAMPFAATGGLGDVLGSLPSALAAQPETDIRVIMPLYSAVKEEWRREMREVLATSVLRNIQSEKGQRSLLLHRQ